MAATALLALGVVAPSVEAAPAWLPPQTLGSTTGYAFGPQVAVGLDGDATAVWVRRTPVGARIETSSRSAGASSWALSQPLSPIPEAIVNWPSAPQVAVDPVGGATAIWSREAPSLSRIETSSLAAGARAWVAPQLLTPYDYAGTGAGEAQVVVDAAGVATAVWYHDDGTGPSRIETASRARTATAWTPLQVISRPDPGENPNGDAGNYQPQLAVDAHGRVTATWLRHHRDGRSSIEVASRPVGSSWTPAEPLATFAADQRVQSLAMTIDPTGATTAIWHRSDDREGWVEAASRSAGSASWSPPEVLAAVGRPSAMPRVAADARGNVSAIWLDGDPAAKRVVTASRAAGERSWSDGHVLATAGDDWRVGEPRIAVDRAGGTTALWTRFDETANHVETASRPAGRTDWMASRTLSDLLEGDFGERAPQLAVDPAGNATAVWLRGRGADVLLEAATLDGAGPRLEHLVIPEAGRVGEPIAFSVAPRDVWSRLGETTWAFDDGPPSGGTTASQSFGTPGEHRVRLRSVDEHGNETTVSRTIRIVGEPAVAPPPGPAPPAATSCTVGGVRLLGVGVAGTVRRPRVRLVGYAARSRAGAPVTVQRDGRRVGTTRVATDGTISASVVGPAASRAGYRLVVGRDRSRALRASRSLVAGERRVAAGSGREGVRLSGRVSGTTRRRTLTIVARGECDADATRTSSRRVRTDRRGRFRIVLAAPAAVGAPLVYELRAGRRSITLPVVVVRR